MWTKDTKTEGPLPEGKLPVFQFQANVAHDLNYCGRRVLTGAAVDGRVAQRLEVDLQCDCGLSSPDREHFTSLSSARQILGMVISKLQLKDGCLFLLWMLQLFFHLKI